MKIFLFFFIILNLYANDHKPYSYFEEEKTDYQNLESLKQGYKSNHSNEKFLKKIAEENDVVNFYDLGRSRLNFKIPAVLITKNKNPKPSVLFNCSHHSNEIISTEYCYDIIYDLVKNQKEYEDVLNKINIWVVPIVNPDGSYFFWNKSILMGRKNGFLHPLQNENSFSRGVDLNRNYSFKWNSGQSTASSGDPNSQYYRGSKSFSEPESQAMSILAEQQRFVYSVSFHSSGAKILFPYTIENIKNPNIDFPKYFAERLAKTSKIYRAVKNLYPVDGTDQDYLYFKYGTIALLIESSHHNIQYKHVETVLKNINPVWKEILNECLYGEKIFLKITDEDNNNLEAQIEIDEFKYYNNEKFTSNALTGFYIKPVVEKKMYHLKVSHPLFETKKIDLKSSNDLQYNLIVLNKK